VLAEPDGEAFAAALTALLRDRGERDRLRAAGLARAQRFSWAATAGTVDALLSGGAPAPPGDTPAAKAH
jgi:glycosyltransferase involved in cell wall biosynthesis